MVMSDASHGIKHLGDSAGENPTLTRIESLTPYPIPFRKIRNRTRFSLKCGDTLLNSRLGKWQMLNLSLSIAIGHS